MSQIRKAHTNEVIDRRLRACEIAGEYDAMELVALHDELARVERKWIAKSNEPARTGPRARPLADPDAMNARFERLSRLIDAALRQPAPETPERVLLNRAANAVRERTPLKPPVG